MKNKWFNLSLAGNVVLLCALMLVAQQRSLKSPAAPPPAPAASHPATVAVVPGKISVPPKTMAQLMSQLRTANVPEALLARLAEADFEEAWAKRSEEMQARYDDGDIDDVEMQRFSEQHDADQEREMRALLGDEAFVQWDKKKELADMRRLKLSPDETDSLYRLKKDFEKTQADLSRRLQDGEIDEADYNDQVAKAQKQLDEKMKSTLGEDRFAAWQNPDDGLAGNLKRNLRALNATDDQFSALLEAQKAWNQQREALQKKYPDADMQDDQYAAQLKAIDSTRDQQYQNVLGTNGVAMLERQQDYNFQTLKRYETVWQLTDAEVDHVYAALRDYRKTVDDYQQRAQALEDNGQEVDWPAVDTNIQQFGRQVAQGLQLYLGNDRFQKIRRNEIFAFSPPEVASH